MSITNKVLDSKGVETLWARVKAEFATRDTKINALEEGTYDDDALQQRVTDEITARTEADTALGNRVKALEDLDHEAYKGYADQAELDAVATANAYTDSVKDAILGDGIKDTFDTLVEIQNWIEGDGVDATELTAAIALETSSREAADTAMNTRVEALEGVSALTTAEVEALLV